MRRNRLGICMNKRSKSKAIARTTMRLVAALGLKQDDIKGIGIYAAVIDKAEEIVGEKRTMSAKAYITHNIGFIQVWLKKNGPKIPKRVSTQRSVSDYIQKCKIDPTTNDFLSTFEWRAVRMMALKKYGAVCQCCGASPKTGAVMHVDHIKPRKVYPDLALDLDNLQILCGECNHGKGNWDMTDWRAQTTPLSIEQ